MSIYDDMIEMNKLDEETDRKIYNEKRERRNKKNIRNIRIRKTAFAVIAGSVILIGGIEAVHKYESKPIRVVTTELMTDAGFKRTGDGRRIDDKMTEQELVDYIKANNLQESEIRTSLTKDLKYEGIDYNFGMDKIEKANPDVFNQNEVIEETKGMGR